MARFNQKQQTEHRNAVMEDCERKAWAAACQADWISTKLTENIAEYQRLQAEDKALEKEIKENAEGFNSHTVENRNKRAELQKKRASIEKLMKAVAVNTQEGSKRMQLFLDSVDQNLALADHAKNWNWVEKDEPEEVPAE